MLTHRHKTEKHIELVVTLYVYMRICAKKSHFTYFWVKRETHPKFMQTLSYVMHMVFLFNNKLYYILNVKLNK